MSPGSRWSASATRSLIATGIWPFAMLASAGQPPVTIVACSSMPSAYPNAARSRTPPSGWLGSANESERAVRTTVRGSVPSASSIAAVTVRSRSSRPSALTRAVASMFTPVTGASASDRWREATATASPYMTPAASKVAARVHMTPAASTIGQSARDRRRLTRTRAASDEIKLRRLPGVVGSKSAEYTEGRAGRARGGVQGPSSLHRNPAYWLHERRHRVPSAHLAPQPQDAVAGVVRATSRRASTRTPTTSSTTRSARPRHSSTCRRSTSTSSRDRTPSAWSTGSSPATRRSCRSGASSTRRGATSTARSSTTARSIDSTSASTAGRPPTRSSAGSARTAPGSM